MYIYIYIYNYTHTLLPQRPLALQAAGLDRRNSEEHAGVDKRHAPSAANVVVFTWHQA